jgi:hypothetical protein
MITIDIPALEESLNLAAKDINRIGKNCVVRFICEMANWWRPKAWTIRRKHGVS